MTLSPIFLSTGTLSPVIILSSILLVPELISPSTGTFSPGRTTMVSPTITSSREICISSPSRITVAVLGAKSISLRMDSEVLPFVRSSKYLPSKIRAIITPAVSKYRFLTRLTSPPAMAYTAYTPYKYAAPVPRPIKESMFGVNLNRLRRPTV